MTMPLLSVVIPTHGRPEFLPRAIKSALMSAVGGNVEVIVVPNGADLSWVEVAEIFAGDPRVTFHPIQTAHACAARNHGFDIAKGTYIRFLDDDDFLYPDQASAQLEYLIETQAEICTGRVHHIDVDSRVIGETTFVTDSDDFVLAAIARSMSLPTANVYLAKSIKKSRWPENVRRAQDYIWMLDLAMHGEWRWRPFDEVVGGWQHHSGPRVSSASAAQELQIWVAETLLTLHAQLKENSRLSPKREAAIAQELWNFLHVNFPRFPVQCYRLAKKVKAISASARPDVHLFGRPGLVKMIDPLLWEMLIFPKRFINHLGRLAYEKLFGESVTRRL